MTTTERENDTTDADFWSEEWVKLLGLSAAIVTSADSVMDAMRGDLGESFKGKSSVEAAPEIARRVRKWRDARNALIAYAREAEDGLTKAARGAGR